jgi:hypothetical protein
MRSRKRDLEDKAMEDDMREELSMDEVADLLDGRRPLEDRVAHMRELAERQAESHEALMEDEVDDLADLLVEDDRRMSNE